MKTEQNAKGPRERRFEMWMNIIGGIYIISGIAVVIFGPDKIRRDIFVPWFLILCGILSYKTWRVRQIRQVEQTR